MKNTLNKLFKYIFDKNYRFLVNSYNGLYKTMPDEKYLKKLFRVIKGYELNLENPRTFNEKLQWLKLHDRKPEYMQIVDKYKVREYIAEKLGEEYLIPLLGVYDKVEDIDFDKLPSKFVLKCNHNSGLGMYICKDKSKLDIKMVKKGLKKALKQDYYLTGREWPYKDVERKIICEQYLEDEETQELRDYKFFCFNGKATHVMVCKDRSSGNTKFHVFDRDWNLFKYKKADLDLPENFTLSKPEQINEMFEIAEKLSKDFTFVRVDLYNCNGKIYFGELTLFPHSGADPDLIKETDKYFGELLILNK